MIKRFFTSKVGRTITSIIGGIIGFGGSTFAGLDPDFAILVAATAVVAIFLGIDKAARFKELFDGDLDKKGGR